MASRLLFCILAGASAIVHNQTRRRDSWTAATVPNPMKSPEQCGLPKPGHICDPDKVLSENERAKIEEVLVNITKSTVVQCPDGKNHSYQAAVLVVDSVASSEWLGWWDKERTGEAFAHRVGDRWGVGHAGCDNGVILFLSVHDRMFYLKTAKRTREVLSDSAAATILDNMRKLLKGGYVGDAIFMGCQQIQLTLQHQAISVYRSWSDYLLFFVLGIVFCCHLPQLVAMLVMLVTMLLGLLLYPLAKLADTCTGCWRHSERRAQDDLERVQKELAKDEFDQGMCPICLENFEEGAEMRKLPCKHCFHTSCIDKWIRDHESCPLCRADVDVELTDADKKKPEHYQRRLRFYLSRLSLRHPSVFSATDRPFYVSSNHGYFVYTPSPTWTDSLTGHVSTVTSSTTAYMGSAGGGGGGFGGGGFGGGGGAGGGW